MRWAASRAFAEALADQQEAIQSVAVVGGSTSEPEIAWLAQRRDLSIHVFGIEGDSRPNFSYLDLNCGLLSDTPTGFDLVHCAHVLEHVWDVKTALATLLSLARPGGLVWVNVPASCHAHGSPDYFFAGFQADGLARLATSLGASVLVADQVGSMRWYYYEHSARRWPTMEQFRAPVASLPGGRGGRLRSYARWAKYLPSNIQASLRSPRETPDPRYAVQAWLLLQRPSEASEI